MDPEKSDDGTTLYSGYTNVFGEIGSMSNTAPVPGYPNHFVVENSCQTDFPFDEENPTQVRFTIQEDAIGATGEIPVAEAVQNIEFWDMDNAAGPTRFFTIPMYQTASGVNPDNGRGWASWEGTVEFGRKFNANRTYNMYFYDVLAQFEDVPEVRWVEESAPGQAAQLNQDTLPHVLWRKPDGNFQFGSFNDVSTVAASSLSRRTSGDDTSNPFPAFVGAKIKDVATFQNRLCLLTLDKVSMSVTGQPHDWFRGTVTQLLATSPISIQSTAASATSLTHFVEHNNDLMVFSPKGQYRFDGNRGLTPENASLPQASAYPCETLAVPVAAGNDVFFSTTYGTSAGISQFSLDPQIDNLSIASPMADLQVGLIGGDIQQIIATPNLGLILNRVHVRYYSRWSLSHR